MEQIQNELRRAGYAKKELAQHRAMELQAKHPQLAEYDNEPEPTEAPMRGSGGEAGLARLVGKGRRRKAGGTNGVMKQMKGDGVISDLNIPIVSGIARIFGLGKGRKGKKKSMEEAEMSSDSESEKGEKLEGGARHQGKMLGEHLMKLHGAGFFDDFAKGFMSVIKPVAGIASMMPGTIGTVGRVASGILGNGQPKRGRGRPRKMCGGNAPHASTGNAIEHAEMAPAYSSLPGAGLGGADVPPNGIAPMAYGNVPQAPASFKRNTVGMGRPRKALGADGHGMAPAPKMAGGRSARGQMISKLMKEKGLTLGQASKWLKEHGSA